jgi:FixJ family two-component response regulator
VAAALRRDEQARAAEQATRALRETFERLTQREREAMALVTSGCIRRRRANPKRPYDFAIVADRAG